MAKEKVKKPIQLKLGLTLLQEKENKLQEEVLQPNQKP